MLDVYIKKKNSSKKQLLATCFGLFFVYKKKRNIISCTLLQVSDCCSCISSNWDRRGYHCWYKFSLSTSIVCFSDAYDKAIDRIPLRLKFRELA